MTREHPQAQASEREAVEALQAARSFIRNGVELGYIRMPDADLPDPAHQTLPKIEAALAALASRSTEPGGEAPDRMKDHEIAKLVNDLRDAAIEFHAHQSLRERIAYLIRPLASTPPPISASKEAEKCKGCNGEGMVGGLRQDGYHSEECPFCKGSGLAFKEAAPAGEWPRTCDGKEQAAFEAWAKLQGYKMQEHPLLYLFLDDRTDGARNGWKAGMNYAVDQIRVLTSPAPAQAPSSEPIEAEFTDTARAALLWVLWHHQGGSCKVGQPIRFALGMGQHDHLSEYQIREAKRWAALPEAEPSSAVSPLTSDAQIDAAIESWYRNDLNSDRTRMRGAIDAARAQEGEKP